MKSSWFGSPEADPQIAERAKAALRQVRGRFGREGGLREGVATLSRGLENLGTMAASTRAVPAR